MLKKIFVFTLCAAMMLTMCSCKKSEKTEATSETAVVEEQQVKEVEETKPHTTNYSENEVTEKVTVIVDGKEVTPTDNNGEAVETIIHDGVVYLPVKTVADAAGKAYYWDGPNYTVYLGDMNGGLEYPTVELESMTSVNQSVKTTEKLVDNYGNRYSKAIYNSKGNCELEYLLNMKYSRFKGILYIPEGTTSTRTGYLQIVADGKTIYTSPEMTRTSAPVEVDVDVTGYNDVKIEFSIPYSYYYDGMDMCLANAGFYQ